jgi:DNA-binding response OmpR family regulator
VLVAEDDQRQAEVIRRYLAAAGYRATVVSDGLDAFGVIRDTRPDLVILDVMMPGLGGLEVCRLLRRDSTVPVLMLTARTGEDEVLAGLDVGADDYVTKPYRPRELVARVRTLLRRSQWEPPRADDSLRVGALAISPERHVVTMGSETVNCTQAEFQILATLAAQPDRVFSRGQLLRHARGFESWATERTVDMHILKLRRKIEPDPRRPVYLLAVYGVGYKITDGSR